MKKFSHIFRKYILLWAFLSMFIGYLSGKFNPERAISLSTVTEPLLFIMILIMIIPTDLSNILKIKRYIMPVALAILLFLISPFIAHIVSGIIPKPFGFLRTGIILVSTTPPDAMLSAWAGFLEADILLTLIIQSVTFFLWIFLLPFGLSVLFRGNKIYSMLLLTKNLVILIIIPFIIAIIIKAFLRKRLSPERKKRFRISLSTISGMIELFIIMISIALNSEIISKNPIIILWGVLTAIVYYAGIFIVALFTAATTKMSYENSIPIVYENATKNLPLAMVVALTTFNEQAILGVAACMLVQFPISAFFFNIINLLYKKDVAVLS